MADVTLNETALRGGIVNDTTQHVELATNQVPVFLYIGDSTAVGWVNSPGSTGESITTYKNVPQNNVPESYLEVCAIGQYWSKYAQNDNTGTGENFDLQFQQQDDVVGSLPDNAANYYGFEFQKLHPRLGGGALGQAGSDPNDFDFDDFTTRDRIGAPSPVWTLAQNLYGLFVDSDYNPVEPHYIYFPFASSRINSGDDEDVFNFGTTCWASDTSATTNGNGNIIVDDPNNPRGGTLYEHYFKYYVSPAITKLQAEGKDPILCGCFAFLGGNDAGNTINNTLTLGGGNNTWDIAADLIVDLKNDMATRLGIPDIPWVGYIPWRVNKYAGQTSLADNSSIDTLKDNLVTAFTDTMDMGCYMDPGELPKSPGNYNNHFDIGGTMAYGKLAAAAYRKLLARKDTTVTGYDVTATVT